MMLAALVTLWLLDAVIERGGWWRVALLGLALGAACLVKFSGLLLAVAMPVAFAGCVAFVRDFRLPLRAPLETRVREGRRRAAWQSLVVLAAVAVVALLVINGVYGFFGTFRRLDTAKLQSSAMRSLAAGPVGWFPVPLPADYVAGLDGQQASVEQGETVNYLNGRWSQKGGLPKRRARPVATASQQTRGLPISFPCWAGCRPAPSTSPRRIWKGTSPSRAIAPAATSSGSGSAARA